MIYLGLFVIFLIFSTCYVIARSISYSNHKIEKEHKSFWSKESEANFTRRKDISNLDYLVLTEDRLPFDYASTHGAKAEVDEILTLLNKRIINLSMYTNTDLKLMYGPANLDDLTEYDNNYTTLIRLLDRVSTTIYEAAPTDAENVEITRQFLEYAIGIDSDISNSYILLGQIYKDTNKTVLFNHLIEKAESISSLSGKTIVRKLKEL